MPDFEELYPARFVKGVTLDGHTTIKIVSMVGEKLKNDEDQEQLKAVLTVKMRDKRTGEIEQKELVWNKTNAVLTAEIFGRDYSQWAGKLITIAYDPGIMFGKERKGGIRVCGSPHLKSPLEVKIKRPRRKRPEVYLLQPTGGGEQKESAKAAVTASGSALDDSPKPTPEDLAAIATWSVELETATDLPGLLEIKDKAQQVLSSAALQEFTRRYIAACDRVRQGH